MVFVEGTKQSIDGVISAFDEFVMCSGLHISLDSAAQLQLPGVHDI